MHVLFLVGGMAETDAWITLSLSFTGGQTTQGGTETPQTQQHPQRNPAFLCKVGCETVQEIVMRTCEVFNLLKNRPVRIVNSFSLSLSFLDCSYAVSSVCFAVRFECSFSAVLKVTVPRVFLPTPWQVYYWSSSVVPSCCVSFFDRGPYGSWITKD